jgi:hypothetical protein
LVLLINSQTITNYFSNSYGLNGGLLIYQVKLSENIQEMLNKQLLPTCDMLVGVFRTRIGTTTRNAESGTVDEINEFIKTKRPVLLYFCNVLSPQDESDEDQTVKLDGFKRSIRDKGVVWEYSTPEDLSKSFFKHLLLKINDLQKLPAIPEGFGGPTNSSIDKLVKFYNRASIDWNVYLPTVPSHKGTLDRLEQDYHDLFDIINTLNDSETKKIHKKLYDALRSLRYVIDSGRQGPSFFSAFWNKSKKKKEHDTFFSLIKESINELKGDQNPEQNQT